MEKNKLRVGISIGDINGVGPEVILKALNNDLLLRRCIPIIYGSSKVLSYHRNIISDIDMNFSTFNEEKGPWRDKINVVNCWDENVEITLGLMTEAGGKYAKIALEHAVKDLKDGKIDCLVTAPIHKKAIRLAGFEFPGHTEYLASEFGADKYVMTMVSDNLRVAVLTGHIPVSKVAESLTAEHLKEKIEILHTIVQKDFGVQKPLIAVMGLNPHAGDDGVIGNEDQEITIPVIEACKEKGIRVVGPFSTDGFFGSGMFKKFDGVLAMYHDQGLVPFKTISQQTGVNYTAGLPVVRTSPDHGTAYDLAGKNKADARSMRNAIYAALDIYKNRSEFAKNQKERKKRSEPSDK